MKTKIVHLHASGKFNASHSQTITRLNYIESLGANVITVTEVDFLRAALIEFAGNKWGLYHPQGTGRKENAVLWLKSEFTLDAKGADRLTQLHLRTGRTAPLYATTVVLKTKDGTRFLVSSTHLPAHLDVPAVLNNTASKVWASIVHMAASRGWHRVLRKYKCHNKILGADWNLDFKRAAVVAYAKSRFPRLKSGWNFKSMGTHLRSFGTHGKRFIDTSLSNLTLIRASVVFPTTAGYDHRIVKTLYEL